MSKNLGGGDFAMSMADAAEILKALVPVVSILAAVVSILMAASAILQNLERARRELAVNLIYNFANQTDWATGRAIGIAKELPDSIVCEIGAKRSVSIPNAYYDGIVSILRTAFPEEDLPAKPSDGSQGLNFQISTEQSRFIYFLWFQWLNRLEGTLAAWQQGAAATDLMSLEFAPLVKGSSAELAVLTKIRDGLPVIEEFCQQQQRTGGIKVRPKLGLFPWRP